jgi:AraC-like DNA-binding protein
VTQNSVARTYSSGLQAFRARAESYIRANLQDRSLDVAKIAQRLGCSTRYVHLAFAQGGVTAARYIWSSRLAQCQRAIMEIPAHSNLKQVALTWGFSSGAHFSRSFKRAFGIAPSILIRGASNREPPQARAGIKNGLVSTCSTG